MIKGVHKTVVDPTIAFNTVNPDDPLRDRRQQEFANMYWESDQRQILLLAPRFGKIFTTINILEKLPSQCTVLIAYPDIKIKIAWESDFIKRNYTNPNITFVTHLSIHKYQRFLFDIIIIDEIHLLSKAQLDACKILIKGNKRVLGLTGTLTGDTEDLLYRRLRLPVLAQYTMDQAVEEGIVVDYHITIFQVPLDIYRRTRVKNRFVTEKARFNNLTWVIHKMEEEKKKGSMFMRLARMRIIQKSISKLKKTKELLAEFPDERILVFCGITDIADNLGIPAYHSKVKEKKIFEDFLNGIGNKLAVIKIGNTGSTYKPLDKVIINYFSSSAEDLAQRINRCMGLEYNNPDKKAQIYIVTSDEEVELKWLTKALEFFDTNKITYL